MYAVARNVAAAPKLRAASATACGSKDCASREFSITGNSVEPQSAATGASRWRRWRRCGRREEHVRGGAQRRGARCGSERFHDGAGSADFAEEEERNRGPEIVALRAGFLAPAGFRTAGAVSVACSFASDLSTASLDTAPYAISLAQENEARLLLVHVMRHPHKLEGNGEKHFELSVAEAIHRLYETVPKDVQLHFPPEVAVEYGEAAKRIVEAAKQRDADLIVLGVRTTSDAVIHLEASTAHKVVAHATRPVLTVR
jgi:nucleotide-binding universal stress UspA family protein